MPVCFAARTNATVQRIAIKRIVVVAWGEGRWGRVGLLNWAYDASATLLVQGRSYWLAIFGTFLTVAGFGMTYFQFLKTRGATEAVTDEVRRIKFSVTRYEASIETERAEQALKAADGYMRSGDWVLAGDSVNAISRSLHILIELSVPEFTLYADKLREALSHTERLSERIDQSQPSGLPSNERNKALSALRSHGRTIVSVRISLDRSSFGE